MTCPSQEAPDGAIGARYPGSHPLLCGSPCEGPLKVAPVATVLKISIQHSKFQRGRRWTRYHDH